MTSHGLGATSIALSSPAIVIYKVQTQRGKGREGFKATRLYETAIELCYKSLLQGLKRCLWQTLRQAAAADSAAAGQQPLAYGSAYAQRKVLDRHNQCRDATWCK